MNTKQTKIKVGIYISTWMSWMTIYNNTIIPPLTTSRRRHACWHVVVSGAFSSCIFSMTHKLQSPNCRKWFPLCHQCNSCSLPLCRQHASVKWGTPVLSIYVSQSWKSFSLTLLASQKFVCSPTYEGYQLPVIFSPADLGSSTKYHISAQASILMQLLLLVLDITWRFINCVYCFLYLLWNEDQ